MQEPSPLERRITLRLVAYWEKMRNGRPMPTENDINPEDIEDLWDYCFLIHVADLDKPDYGYIYLGDAIISAYQEGLSAEDLGGIVSLHPSKLARSYHKVISSQRPVIEEGEFPNLAGNIVKYRQCLLPLGGNNKVDAIFGGMRYKVQLVSPSSHTLG